MACNNSTQVYYSGSSFSLASQLYSDVNLTTVAPDGLYSFDGVYRLLSGGVLGPPTLCTTCQLPCSGSLITGGGGVTLGDSGKGKYHMTIDVGSLQGAIIVRFNPAVNPSKLTWTYDGVSASEYSSATYGYTQDLIGEQEDGANGGRTTCNGSLDDIEISNNNGSSSHTFSGYKRIYDFQAGQFVPEISSSGSVVAANVGPYSAAEVNLVNGTPGYFMMVVPKPAASPSTLELVVEQPCGPSTWNIDVNCPVSLNSFTAGVLAGGCGVYSTNIFTATPSTPTGISPGPTIAVNDWAFVDADGVTPLPAGRYPVQIGATNYFVTVDTNGIVTNVVAC
tara:strand:+ start:5629 stop:6636 length:1008 start_codon:yes stop_codon:yes gene_type:complete